MTLDVENTARPCIGCGYCCQKAPCALGASLHGPKAPCPSLVWNGERYVCQEVSRAFRARDWKRLSVLLSDLAIGAGCCSPLNSQRAVFAKNDS